MTMRTAVCRTLIALVVAGSLTAAEPASPVPAVDATPALRQPAVGAAILRGEERLAFPTAVAALAAARSGDVVLLAPGTHRGPLLLATAGVTLRGEPGARVDGAAAGWRPQWEAEPAYGPTAFSAAIPFEPVTVRCDDRAMIDARESRGGLALHALGVGRAGRSALGAIFTWRKQQGRLIVSFAGPDEPARHRIEASPAGTVAVTVRGDNCTVEGLVVTGGAAGVELEGTAGSTVRRCLVYACDVGIRIGPGARDCHVVGNDVTLHADALNANCDPAGGLAGDDVWGAHKNFGTYDKTGIAADRGGPDNEIAGNYLYDVWDGIENGNGVGKEGLREHYEKRVATGTADANRGLRVHHNRIDLTQDDALSPGDDLMDNRWHSNVVSRARCAVRVKTPDIGPFYFYDNLLFASGDGLRLYKTAPASATAVIHNNLVIHPDGVIYHSMGTVAWDDPWLARTLPRGTPGYHLYNNLFVSERQFTSQAVGSGGEIAPDFTADRNLFTCARSPLPALLARDATSLFDATPRFVDSAAGDWRLVPGSPGSGAGLPLTSFPIPAVLPAGYTAPAQPDIGLLHIEPQLTPRGPVSGLWALADAALGMAERRPEDVVLPVDRWQLLGSGDLVVQAAADRPLTSITLLRAADRAKGTWTVSALAADGTVLASVNGGPPGLQMITLTLPTAEAGPLTVRITDESTARWRVDPRDGAVRVGLRPASAALLAKYDGGSYVLDSEQPAGGASFTVRLRPDFEGVCSAVVVRPDGTRADLPADGVVATNGVGGTYRLLLTFTKRAYIGLEPAGQTLWLAADQPRAPLRSRWPRPTY